MTFLPFKQTTYKQFQCIIAKDDDYAVVIVKDETIMKEVKIGKKLVLSDFVFCDGAIHMSSRGTQWKVTEEVNMNNEQ